MKVYLVGEAGCEHDMLIAIYADRSKALVAFNEHRLELLGDAKAGLQRSKEDAAERLKTGTWFDGEKISEDSMEHFEKIAVEGEPMYAEMIKKLSEEDPDKIDNYPHDTPYLMEEEVIL